MRSRIFYWSFLSVLFFTSILRAGYVGGVQDGDRAYLLDTNNRFVVYDLDGRSVVRTVSTTARPRLLRANDTGVYLAQGNNVLRYSRDGEAAGTFMVADGHVRQLDIGPAHLLVVTGDTHTLLRLADGSVEASWPTHSMDDTIMTSDAGALFTFGFSDQLERVTVHSDGSLSPAMKTEASEHLTSLSPLRLVGGGTFVLSQSGHVFRADDLTYAGGIGKFNHLVEVGPWVYTFVTEPVSEGGGHIRKLDGNFLERGRAYPNISAFFMAAYNENMLLFHTEIGSPANLGVATVPQAEILPTDTPPADPFGLAYTPAGVTHAPHVTYLVDPDGSQVHRFDWNARQALPGIPVEGAPSRLEYVSGSGRVFAGYPDGRVTQLKTDGSGETVVLQLANACEDLVSVGSHLLIGTYGMYRSLNAAGQLAATRYLDDPLDDITYVPGRDEVLGRRSTSLKRLTLNSDGIPVGEWLMSLSSPGTSWYEIRRVKADGSGFVTGNGHVYTTEGFEEQTVYPHGFTDMRWMGDALISIDPVAEGCRVRWWEDSTAPSRETTLEGSPVSLEVNPTEVRVVTLVEGQPRFTVLGHDLNQRFASTVNRRPEALDLTSSVVPLSAGAGDLIGTIVPRHDNEGPRTYTYELILDASGLFLLENDGIVADVPDKRIFDPEADKYKWVPDFISSYTLGWPDVRQVTIRATDQYGAGGDYPVQLHFRSFAPPPLAPLSAPGRPFEPEESVMDDQGVLYFLSRDPLHLFRYDTTTGEFLSSMPLDRAPRAIRYHPERNRLYLLYRSEDSVFASFGNNVVTEVNPAEEPLRQTTVFYKQDNVFLDMLPLGSDLVFPHRMTYDYPRSNYFLAVYDGDWNLKARELNGNIGTEYHVDEAGRRIVYDENRLPSILRWDRLGVDGGITGRSVENTDALYMAPMVLNAAGTRVVMGDGTLYDMETSESIASLPRGFDYGAWRGDELITLESTPEGNTRVCGWMTPFSTAQADFEVEGTPEKAFTHDGEVIVVTRVLGQPMISSFDTEWNLTRRNPINRHPTDVGLDTSSFDEGLAMDSVIGSFSCTDPFPGITHTYELDPDLSDPGFAVRDGNLVVSREFDYFTDSRSYTLQVKAVDTYGFESQPVSITLALNHVPQPPLSLEFQAGSFREGDAAGWTGGRFTATDRDPDTGLSFHMVSDPLDAFGVEGDRLVTTRALGPEDVGELEFVARVQNGHGLSLEKTFSLTVDSEPDFAFDSTPPAAVRDERLRFTGTLSHVQDGDVLEWRVGSEVVGSAPATDTVDLEVQLQTPGSHTVQLIHRDPEGRERTRSFDVEWDPPRELAWVFAEAAREAGRVRGELLLRHEGGVEGLFATYQLDPSRVRAARFIWDDAWFDRTYSSQYQPDTGVLTLVFSGGGTPLPPGELRLGHLEMDLHSAVAAYLLSGSATDVTFSDITGDVWPSGGYAGPLEADVQLRELRADANGNGRLDVGDAVWLQRLVLDLEPRYPRDNGLNDLTGDGLLTSADVQQVLYILAGLREEVPHVESGQAMEAEAMEVSNAPAEAMSDTPAWNTGPVRFEVERVVGPMGDTVQVVLLADWVGVPPAGVSFRLEYPPEAIRFTQHGDHAFGDAVPSTEVYQLWNPATSGAAFDYASQTGGLKGAAATSGSWSTSGTELARFTLTVQPGAFSHDWALVATDVRLAGEDGQLTESPGAMCVFSTSPHPVMSYQTWATHHLRPRTAETGPEAVPRGHPNAFRYVTGMDVWEESGEPFQLVHRLDGTAGIRLNYPLGRPGFSPVLEASLNLVQWHEVPASELQRDEGNHPSRTGWGRVELWWSESSPEGTFFRLRLDPD